MDLRQPQYKQEMIHTDLCLRHIVNYRVQRFSWCLYLVLPVLEQLKFKITSNFFFFFISHIITSANLLSETWQAFIESC